MSSQSKVSHSRQVMPEFLSQLANMILDSGCRGSKYSYMPFPIESFSDIPATVETSVPSAANVLSDRESQSTNQSTLSSCETSAMSTPQDQDGGHSIDIFPIAAFKPEHCLFWRLYACFCVFVYSVFKSVFELWRFLLTYREKYHLFHHVLVCFSAFSSLFLFIIIINNIFFFL